jgi:Tfp pilus assembly protein PilX
MPNPIRKRPLAAEAGFALPTAIIVLFVLTLLTGAAITVSTQTSGSTTRDDNVKAALEAAEAGLQVASYRLGQLKPAETECINGSATEVPGGGSTYCKSSSSENLGNGASFQYWTSLPLTSGKKCAGQTVEIKTGYTPRCVTSEGTVSNVTQRVAARVESAPGEPLFSIKGIVGLTEVKISGSVKVPAVVGSNEKIIGEGSAAFERGFEICPPKGSFKPEAGSERNKSGVTVGGVGGMLSNPPLEKTRSASECPIKAPLPSNHATAASNEDSRIGVSDKLEGTTSWKAAGYELELKSNGKITLGGSKYYLCNFKATNNSRLRIAATAKVEIFVDSPEDPGSTCKAGTGKFTGEGEFIVENEAKNPGALLIEMYGKGPFEIANGSAMEGSIYAPEAEITINGGTKFKGGIVGNKVHLTNGAGIFEWSEEVLALTNGNPTPYSRKSWEQCTPGSGASEGC